MTFVYILTDRGRLQHQMLTLELVVDLYCWTMLFVLGLKIVYTLAITKALDYTTVNTLKMLVSYVEVKKMQK